MCSSDDTFKVAQIETSDVDEAIVGDDRIPIQSNADERENWPLGVRMWIITGAAMLLWTIIGGLAFWILY